MKSVMTPQQLFNQVASPDIQRSTFDRSHGYKTTFNAGKLIPIFIDEALPGDTLKLNTSLFGRLATPLKPIMDNIHLDVHYFSVPIRLVWENWQRFNGEQDNPSDSVDFIMPTITSPTGGYQEHSIYDYLGIPTKIANLEHRADFLRAINLIWNQWYRDQNLQDSLTVPKDDGPDLPSLYSILPRGKRKDYFTAALPFAQKAQPVSIPVGGTAPLTTNSAPVILNSTLNPWIAKHDTLNTTLNNQDGFSTYPAGQLKSNLGVTHAQAKFDPNGTLSTNLTGISADLSQATAVTINALREAFQIQKMYERDARGGTRYTELLQSHFGVISPDARLQRPEYLGGGTLNLNVNPIAQTAPTATGSTPQGNLAAVGQFSDQSHGFMKSFTEHEIVIGFISARADLTYQQGLDRMWSRKTRFDFYWPALAHLGEQAILNKEIYAQGASAPTDPDNKVFGYQERWAEYRYKNSRITGLFRSNAAQSLDVWHLSQDFSTLPSLNASFIEEKPPIERIVAVTDEPQFILDAFFDYECTRPMPTFSIPGLIDHF